MEKKILKFITLEIPYKLIRNPNITSIQLKVYEAIYLYNLLDEQFPPNRKIAETLNMSLEMFKRTIKELEAKGMCEIINHVGTTNSYMAIKYFENNSKENVADIPSEMLITDRLTVSELRLYQVLKSFEKMGKITPSQNILAEYCGNLTVRTVCNLIKSLESKRLITHKRNFNEIQGNTYNEYFIFDEKKWLEENKIK